MLIKFTNSKAAFIDANVVKMLILDLHSFFAYGLTCHQIYISIMNLKNVRALARSDHSEVMAKKVAFLK